MCSYATSRASAVSGAVLAVILTASCGGGDSPTEPPTQPPGQTVASVTVSPSSATLTVPGTLQLSATARDASGAVVNVAVTWSSASNAIVSVTPSGLITAIGPGSTVVSATAGGRTGTASVTVSAAPTSPYGPVVDRQAIGAAGGTVGNGEVAITIPGGAFISSRTIDLVRDTSEVTGLEGTRASARYILTGFPAGQVTTVGVRIQPSGNGTGTPAIGLQRPAQELGDTVAVVMGLELYGARDSSGNVVASVPISGRAVSATSSSPFPSARVGVMAALDPESFSADAMFSAVFGLANIQSPGGRFTIWGAVDDPEMPQKLQQAALWMDAAYTRLTETYGYADLHRNRWPMLVMVEKTTASWNGVFRQFRPWPFDVNFSMIGMNRAKMGRAEQPGTAIHELYHFMQQAFRPGMNIDQYGGLLWLAEASSTWMSENHPQSPRPFTNTTALSWRDSLYSGLHPDMVANSGYGKAPMIKYVAKRWGNDKVKEIWASVAAGVHPIGALVNALPETPSQWWPDALAQQYGGSLYPWTVEQIIPQYGHFSLTLTPGRRGFESALLAPLAVNVVELRRDTAMFGPNFALPVYIDTASIGKSRILVLEMPAAATHFRPIAGGDTVLISGARLQSADTILMLVTATQPVVPPYNTGHRIRYGVDLRLPNGDWYAPHITSVQDGLQYACDVPGDSLSLDVASNATAILQMLSTTGTWTRAQIPTYPASYTWAVSPAFADSLRMLGATLESTVRETTGDTVVLSARLRWDLLSAGSVSELRGRLSKSGFGGWWWLVPMVLLPVAGRKRLRRMTLPLASVTLLILISGCDIGFIGWDIDESLEYTFTKVRYTADRNDPQKPLLELRDGSGKTTMHRLRTEAWVYTYNDQGEKTDSTRRACTGTGQATYTSDGVVFQDGVTPPDDESATLSALIERAVGVPGLAQRIEAQRAHAEGRPR